MKRKNNFYTYFDAYRMVQKLGIKTIAEYRERYKEDARLPCHPGRAYADNWVSWPEFFGKERASFYGTLEEAKTAAQLLDIKTIAEYRERCKEDARLPCTPDQVYADSWVSWMEFFGKERVSFYETLEEAKIAVQLLGMKTKRDYSDKYKIDPKLPSTPDNIYSRDWISWENFLIPTYVDCLIKAKTIIQVAGIQSSKDYSMRYKALNASLPRHPDRVYREEWIDWYDFLGIRKSFYTYKEASDLVKDKGITTQLKYDRYRVDSGDARLYKNPAVHYDEWINWYVFCGTQEPFQPAYIREEYKQWKDAIEKFMYKAKGGISKKTSLCRFERLYIEKHGFGYSPVEFLSSGRADRKLYNKFLDEYFPPSKKNTAANHINEFLDYVLREHLTLEDEETGELVRVSDAKNPFESIYIDQVKVVGRNETVKPRLQFQFLQDARMWIIPDEAKTFRDLSHLYEEFDSDWHEIPLNLIDETDPDCVVKQLVIKNEIRYYIWSPINWMHTYVLMELPSRGRQIAYNDSGEGDAEIPFLDEIGKICWRKNDGPLAGQTKHQSMVKKYPNDVLGHHNTTNKTSNEGRGYSVPWIPAKVAYWLIRLREWQSKYNPIEVATSWTQCKRTNLSPLQLKSKGQNCFLFRAYGQVEAISFQGVLADRIAVSLYHTQPDQITLATCESGKLRSVSHYKSLYSPDAMRVGLISAFIFEYGLPVEIVMKIVGHSCIVMTIYYAKTNSTDLIKRMEEGEKKSVKRHN